MPAGYTPITVQHISPEDEMNAAFDNGSDDEDLDSHHPSAAQTPLLSHTRAQSQPSIQTGPTPIVAPTPRTHNTSGDYDFEYDYPLPRIATATIGSGTSQQPRKHQWRNTEF
ncbi:hypothetical protein OPQ81_004224 [Rhizoctonia solani]|nr:hypothetical protein OPQ81_004224 [Rhizoctonia solani]